jgi:hypothetical protein
VEFAWDLMEASYLWPPWLTGSYHPRCCIFVSFGVFTVQIVRPA